MQAGVYNRAMRRLLVSALLVVLATGCPAREPAADDAGVVDAGADAGAVSSTDGGVAGLELLPKLAGLWSGPADQTPLKHSEEVTDSLWLRPERALSMIDRRDFPILPPTTTVLQNLARLGSWNRLRGEFNLA